MKKHLLLFLTLFSQVRATEVGPEAACQMLSHSVGVPREYRVMVYKHVNVKDWAALAQLCWSFNKEIQPTLDFLNPDNSWENINNFTSSAEYVETMLSKCKGRQFNIRVLRELSTPPQAYLDFVKQVEEYNRLGQEFYAFDSANDSEERYLSLDEQIEQIDKSLDRCISLRKQIKQMEKQEKFQNCFKQYHVKELYLVEVNVPLEGLHCDLVIVCMREGSWSFKSLNKARIKTLRVLYDGSTFWIATSFIGSKIDELIVCRGLFVSYLDFSGAYLGAIKGMDWSLKYSRCDCPQFYRSKLSTNVYKLLKPHLTEKALKSITISDSAEIPPAPVAPVVQEQAPVMLSAKSLVVDILSQRRQTILNLLADLHQQRVYGMSEDAILNLITQVAPERGQEEGPETD